MPQIPQMPEQQRLEYTSPVSIASTEEASVAGRTIARVGEAISNLGSTIAEVDARKERAKAALDGAEASQKGRQAALEIRDELYASGLPENQWVSEFQKRYQKRTKGLQNINESSNVQKSISNALLDVQNDFTSNISDTARSQWHVTAANQAAGLRSRGNAIVYADENQFDSQVANYAQVVQSQFQNQTWDAATAQKEWAAAPASFAETAITGMVGRKNFDGAARLLEKKFSKHFTAEKIRAMQDYITRAQLSFQDRQLKETDRAEKADKKLLEKDQTRNASNFAVALLAAKGNPNLQARIINDMKVAAAKDQISDQDYRFNVDELLKSPSSKVDDSAAKNYFIEKMTNPSANMDALRAELIAKKKSVNPDTYGSLLTMVESRQKSEERDPNYQSGMTFIRGKLTAEFGGDSANTLMGAFQRNRKTDAFRKIMEIKEKRGVDLFKAWDIFAKEYGIAQAVILPRSSSYDSMDKVSLEAWLKREQERFKKGEINAKQAMESNKAYEEQKRYLEQQEGMGQ